MKMTLTYFLSGYFFREVEDFKTANKQNKPKIIDEVTAQYFSQ